MIVSLADMISYRRLRWLGHVARMNDNRLPKQLLFGWLPQRCPPHGVKLHWHDKVRHNLRTFHIDEVGWYVLAQDRQEMVYFRDRRWYVVLHEMVYFIVMVASMVLVDPRIK